MGYLNRLFHWFCKLIKPVEYLYVDELMAVEEFPELVFFLLEANTQLEYSVSVDKLIY
jgi:hypothetical protein